MLFYYSDIRFWQAVNGVLAVWKRKNKKSAVHFPGHSLRLFFLVVIQVAEHSRYSFGALHCEHCLFDNKALGEWQTEGERLYTLLYISINVVSSTYIFYVHIRKYYASRRIQLFQ